MKLLVFFSSCTLLPLLLVSLSEGAPRVKRSDSGSSEEDETNESALMRREPPEEPDCKLRLNEVSTLWPTHSRRPHQADDGQFIELGYECDGDGEGSVSLSSYTLVVLRGATLYSKAPVPLLYVDFHTTAIPHITKRPAGTYRFVDVHPHLLIGNSSTLNSRLKLVADWGGDVTATSNWISPDQFAMKFKFGPPFGKKWLGDADEAKVPTVYLMLSYPHEGEVHTSLKRFLSYCLTVGKNQKPHNAVSLPEDPTKEGVWRTILGSVVDFLAVSADETQMKAMPFIDALRVSRPDIALRAYGLNFADLAHGDFPSGKSLSRCGQGKEKAWLLAEQTPGTSNDCASGKRIPAAPLGHIWIYDATLAVECSIRGASGLLDDVLPEDAEGTCAAQLPDGMENGEDLEATIVLSDPVGSLNLDDDDLARMDPSLVGKRRLSALSLTVEDTPSKRNRLGSMSYQEYMDEEATMAFLQEKAGGDIDLEALRQILVDELDRRFKEIRRYYRKGIADVKKLIGKENMEKYQKNLHTTIMIRRMTEAEYLADANGDYIANLRMSRIAKPQRISAIINEREKYRFIFTRIDQGGTHITFVCAICTKYKMDTPGKGVRFTAPFGDEKKGRTTMDLAREHHKTKHHDLAFKMWSKDTSAAVAAMLSSDFTVDPRAPTPTQIFLRSVYHAVNIGSPGFRHGDTVAFLRSIHTDIGLKHSNRRSFMRAVTMISGVLEDKLNTLLRTSSEPFSVMTDSASDKSARQIILIYVRIVVDDYPRTFFFAAREMKVSETGVNLKNAILEEFEKRGLKERLEESLIALSTDGANNMSGHISGLFGLLRDHLQDARVAMTQKREGFPDSLIFTACSAHKVELAVDRTYKLLASDGFLADWRELLSDMINSLKSFFGPTAVNRNDNLRMKIESHRLLYDKAISFLRVKGIFKVRWTASERMAIENFIRLFKVIWEMMLEIVEHYEQTAGRKEPSETTTYFKAKTFLEAMQDLKFYSFVTYEKKILKCVEIFSLQMQKSAASIFLVGTALNEFKSCMTSLAADPFRKDPSSGGDAAKRVPDGTLSSDINFLHNVVCYKGTQRLQLSTNARCKEAVFGATDSHGTTEYSFRMEYPSGPGNPSSATVTAFKSLNPTPSGSGRGQGAGGANPLDKLANSEQKKAEKEVNLEKWQDAKIAKRLSTVGYKLLDKTLRDNILQESFKAFGEEFKFLDLDYISFTWKNITQEPQLNEDIQARARISTKFHFDAKQIEDEVTKLRNNLLAHLNVDIVKELNAHPLDIALLHRAICEARDVAYPKKIKDLMSAILTIPVSSSAVERGYSQLFYILDTRRSRLTVKNLELLLRIKLNGPDYSNFDAQEYERKWLINHQPTDNFAEQDMGIDDTRSAANDPGDDYPDMEHGEMDELIARYYKDPNPPPYILKK